YRGRRTQPASHSDPAVAIRLDPGGSDEPFAAGVGDGREARVDAEPAQELADVVPHRLLRETERGRDLRRRGAVGEERKHLALTRGEAGAGDGGTILHPLATDLAARSRDAEHAHDR